MGIPFVLAGRMCEGFLLFSMEPPTLPPPDVPDGTERSRFPHTRWTLIRQLRGDSQESSRRSLEELCRQYYLPLYGFIRQQGLDHHDAQDVLQAFFAKFLRAESFARADPARGRLRTFLAVSLGNFLKDWYRRQNRQRDGRPCVSGTQGEVANSFENNSPVPVDSETPGRHLDRIWARELIRRAIVRTGQIYAARGRARLFEVLRPVLENGGSLRGGQPASLASTLGISEGSLRVAMNRLLTCFGRQLQEEVALTVADPSEISEEIAALRELFSAPDPAGRI